jgi:hypothetical protein
MISLESENKTLDAKLKHARYRMRIFVINGSALLLKVV